MLQLRKSYFCGICTLFFQCCFMHETQVLMTVSDSSFFLAIIPWGGITFQCEGLVKREYPMGIQKIIGMGGGGACPIPPFPTLTMRNTVYGKIMENLRNRTSKLSYMSQKIFDNDLVVIHKSKVTTVLSKPAYIGMCILGLSKVLIYKFHHDYIYIYIYIYFFFNWDSPHARLNSHYEAWSYKKRSTKTFPGWTKSV